MSAMTTNPAPGSPAAGISIRGVRHIYPGGKLALDGVDLEIGTGLFGLLGPNGAGKSTLMKIVCTLLQPTAGSVSVLGHDTVKDRQALRARLGYLPQEFSAWRLLCCDEVLDTFARLAGISNKSDREHKVAKALADVGLTAVADRKVKTLSGGMVRRLGVAQALVHDPTVLVVDEPTVGLDPEERLRFRGLMANLSTTRVIVLSTHIVADLGGTCRDLALIDNGKVVFRGAPAELTRYAEGRVFEAVLGKAAADQLDPARFEVVSRVPEGVGVRVRVVSAQGSSLPHAEPVAEPTLEEAYLAFMAARGRSAVVSEGREA
jgi:ABC-type multidrug transport system ATPase subunit